MKKTAIILTLSACLGALVFFIPCNRSNNLLLGRVEAKVGRHTVVVTDCYRTTVPPPEKIADTSGVTTYRFAPCRDTEVMIRGDELTVNGQTYGKLRDGAEVIVDHGRVEIRPQ